MFYTGDKFPKWKNSLFVGAQSPDGYICVAVEKEFRGEAADGAVLRLEPAK